MNRARVVLASILAVGCYSASPPAGVPCDPNAPSCPSGQMCVSRAGMFVCDTEPGDTFDASTIDASSPDDVDGDGISNVLDNCPLEANANQANEDNDATGNLCDNCPPYPSDGADADADGVGDVCDPHALIPGDSITLFEGFAGGTIPAGWSATGTWTVVNGSLLSGAQDNELKTLVIPYATTPNHTLSAFATITALAGPLGGSIGIVDQFDGVRGLHCGGGRSSLTGVFGIIDAETNNFQTGRPHPFEVGTLYRIVLTRRGTVYRCSTVQINGELIETQDVFDKVAGANIGFRHGTASAAYPWIMVVKSP